MARVVGRLTRANALLHKAIHLVHPHAKRRGRSGSGAGLMTRRAAVTRQGPRPPSSPSRAHGPPMATGGEATEHGEAERLLRSLQAADVALHAEAAVPEADHSMGYFFHAVEPHKRLHAAVSDLTPAEGEPPGWQQDPMAVAVPCAPPSMGPHSWGHYRGSGRCALIP